MLVDLLSLRLSAGEDVSIVLPAVSLSVVGLPNGVGIAVNMDAGPVNGGGHLCEVQFGVIVLVNSLPCGCWQTISSSDCSFGPVQKTGA